MKTNIEFKECSKCEFYRDYTTACACSKLGLAIHNLLKEFRLISSDEKRCNWFLHVFNERK